MIEPGVAEHAANLIIKLLYHHYLPGNWRDERNDDVEGLIQERLSERFIMIGPH